MDKYNIYNARKNNKLNLFKEFIEDKSLTSISELEFTCNKKIEKLDKQINDLKMEIKFLNRKLEKQNRAINFKIPLNYSKEIKAEIWEITTFDEYGDIYDKNYNKVYYKIHELYIPEWNITFNVTFDNLNIIVHTKKRYNLNDSKIRANPNNSKFIKEVLLDNKLTYELYNMMKLNNELEKYKISTSEKIKNLLN